MLVIAKFNVNTGFSHLHAPGTGATHQRRLMIAGTPARKRGNAMTKGELIDAVKGDFTKKETAKIVDAVFEAIKQGLLTDARFSYPDFGTFRVTRRAARTGSDPKSHKPMVIPAYKTVVFHVSKNLKKVLQEISLPEEPMP